MMACPRLHHATARISPGMAATGSGYPLQVLARVTIIKVRSLPCTSVRAAGFPLLSLTQLQ